MDGGANIVLGALGGLLLLLGLGLCTAGVFRLLRAKDSLVGIQAAGGAILPGTLLVLLGGLLAAGNQLGTRAVLVLVLLIATGPVSSHALVRAAWLGPREAPDDTESNQEPSETPRGLQDGSSGPKR